MIVVVLLLIIVLLLVERCLTYARDWRGRTDTKLLDWAAKARHHSAKYKSLRDELQVERTKS